jgi:hypothetical protein
MMRMMSSRDIKRTVLAVSSMTMPLIPMSEGLREAMMRSMEPVRSDFRIFDWMPSALKPSGREDVFDEEAAPEEELGGGSGGRARRAVR